MDTRIMSNKHAEDPDLFKLRSPTIWAILLLERICPTLWVIILIAKLSNPFICSIMYRGRSHRTLGLIPILLQLWVLSMHRASHSVVNIKRMQQSVDLTNTKK